MIFFSKKLNIRKIKTTTDTYYNYSICLSLSSHIMFNCCCKLCILFVAINLMDVANLGHLNKLVDQPLTVHLGQNTTLVIIPKTKENN